MHKISKFPYTNISYPLFCFPWTFWNTLVYAYTWLQLYQDKWKIDSWYSFHQIVSVIHVYVFPLKLNYEMEYLLSIWQKNGTNITVCKNKLGEFYKQRLSESIIERFFQQKPANASSNCEIISENEVILRAYYWSYFQYFKISRDYWPGYRKYFHPT